MKKHAYRFREKTSGVTSVSLSALKHLPKIGKPLYLKAYVHLNKYGGKSFKILVRGVNGSVRFGGFSFGYKGEGPHGFVQLLKTLGFNEDVAKHIAFETNWNKSEKLGECFKFNLNRGEKNEE